MDLESGHWISDAELSRWLGLSLTTVRRLGRRADCPAINVGTPHKALRRWPLPESEKWLRSLNRSAPPPVEPRDKRKPVQHTNGPVRARLVAAGLL